MDKKAVARELVKLAKELLAEYGDNVIALAYGGKVEITGKAKGRTENPNFLIVGQYGDWSGFMPLREALHRLDEVTKQSPSKDYRVVER